MRYFIKENKVKMVIPLDRISLIIERIVVKWFFIFSVPTLVQKKWVIRTLEKDKEKEAEDREGKGK